MKARIYGDENRQGKIKDRQQETVNDLSNRLGN